MNPRQFNARFRPLVNAAWLKQCQITGIAANNKTAQDRWYREQLRSCCGIQTTKNATSKQQQHLLDFFSVGSTVSDNVYIPGWSDGQNNWLNKLAKQAWLCSGSDDPFRVWITSLFEHHGVHFDGHRIDRVQTFDKVMAHLAIIANDDRAINHFAEAAEIRMRWQIHRFMGDLEWLQKRHVDTSYIEAIWRQAKLQPTDIDDAPAETLRKALAMIDTHIRRLCKDYEIRPMDLPSRAHPHDKPVLIAEGNHHIHIGHGLEHVPEPIHATAEEPLPF